MGRVYKALTRLSGIPLDAGAAPAAMIEPGAARTPSHVVLANYPLTLDDPFLHLSPYDCLTLREGPMEHFLITGESGAGKTSLSKIILAAYLRQGWGGVICTYKTDDTARAVALAKATGRENSLIVVRPGGPWCTNLLDFELTREGAGAGLVENIPALLMEAITNASSKGYRASKDDIWDDSVGRNLRHGTLLMHAAGLRVTMDRLVDMADGVPSLHPTTGGLIWPADSLVLECLNRAKARGADVATVTLCERYFTRQLTQPGSSRFVSSVLQSWLNMSDFFQFPTVKNLLFAEHPTFTPDVSRKGAIVILDLPAEYGQAGRVAQLTYKAAFIRECLRRQGLPPGERPCFLLCDEYQFLATALDAKLMQAGRSSWVSACCLTQNLPNLYAVMEPGRAHDVVDSIIGNFGTVILGRNKCHVTNKWAAETIGRALVYRWNGGMQRTAGEQRGWNTGVSGGSSAGGGGSSSNSGWSSGTSGGWSASDSVSSGLREERDFDIPPETWLKLSGGGPPYYRVQTILVKGGKRFRANAGKPYLAVAWRQR
jgi:hypothetical protein